MVSWLKPTAIAFVKREGIRLTKRVIPSMIERKSRNICALKRALFEVLANAGIKTWVNAPSANIRRKRLGSLNAMKKISL
jgi:phosphoribosylaminoimidazole-succinocarboxamide synthase